MSSALQSDCRHEFNAGDRFRGMKVRVADLSGHSVSSLEGRTGALSAGDARLNCDSRDWTLHGGQTDVVCQTPEQSSRLRDPLGIGG